MRKLLIKLQRPSLQHLEQVVEEVTFRTARGETRNIALARALENASKLGLLGTAHALQFQTTDYAKALSKDLNSISDPELRTLSLEMLPLLVLQRDGKCHLHSVRELLAEFSQLSRWVSQQLIQTKAQSWFLVLFVPVASLFFGISGRQRFAENISQPMGVAVLLSAIAFYGLGCACLHYVFARRKRILFSNSLAQPAGQAALLRTIASFDNRSGECLPALNRALESNANQLWKQLGRLILFGFTKFPQSSPNTDGFRLGEEEFISKFLRPYLRMGGRRRRGWLKHTHRTLEQTIKTNTMAEASHLTLSLLVVLAIFFLPALFLMLGLSGMNFTPGTLE